MLKFYLYRYDILHVATLRSLSPCGKKVFLLTTSVVFAEMIYFAFRIRALVPAIKNYVP